MTVQDDGGTANGGVDISSTQTFTITVNPVNDAPVIANDGRVMPEAGRLSGQSVLDNDSDLDGDDLTVSLVVSPQHARHFVFNSDGTFEYWPALSFSGTDSFTYLASDGLSSGTAVVTLTVEPIIYELLDGDSTANQVFLVDAFMENTDAHARFQARATLQVHIELPSSADPSDYWIEFATDTPFSVWDAELGGNLLTDGAQVQLQGHSAIFSVFADSGATAGTATLVASFLQVDDQAQPEEVKNQNKGKTFIEELLDNLRTKAADSGPPLARDFAKDQTTTFLNNG